VGMDVCGTDPTDECGKYFRANVFAWHPLWSYCERIAPGVTSQVESGHTNDGDGLDNQGAKLLAAALTVRLDTGDLQRDVDYHNTELELMPDEPCEWCSGTGVRTDKVGIEMGFPEKGWCNACDGKGSRRPFAASYRLHLSLLAKWRDFLQHCGGFEIH
jgi:hypothetical protein